MWRFGQIPTTPTRITSYPKRVPDPFSYTGRQVYNQDIGFQQNFLNTLSPLKIDPESSLARALSYPIAVHDQNQTSPPPAQPSSLLRCSPDSGISSQPSSPSWPHSSLDFTATGNSYGYDAPVDWSGWFPQYCAPTVPQVCIASTKPSQFVPQNQYLLPENTQTTSMMKRKLPPRMCRGAFREVKPLCAFCRRNGEQRSYYEAHRLKDENGVIECPILRKYTCPICGATGDVAHTESYCPHNKHPVCKFAVRGGRDATGRPRRHRF